MNEKVYKGGVKRPANSRCLTWLYRLNRMPFIHLLARKALKRKLGLPEIVDIQPGFFCSAPNIEVGEHTGLGNLFIQAIGKVSIGHHCSFSYDNMILTGTHDYTDFSTVIARPVTIGDNVWVTSNVTILPGVTIGSNTIIGAGSVVTKDIPSGVFAAGNPCKVIKTVDFKIE